MTQPPAAVASVLFGSARDLRRDQLGTYARIMEAHPDAATVRIGPPGAGFRFSTVFRPEGARQVLATDASRYRKKAPVFTEMARILGDGLLTSEGERWRRDRRIVQPLFTARRVAAHAGVMAGAAARLVDSWRDAAAARETVDVHAAASRFALDALGAAVLGEDVAGAGPILARALPLLSEHAARRGLSVVRLPASWPTPANRRAARAQAELQGLVDGLIGRRQAAGAGGEDLLTRLLSARDPEGGGGLDDRGVREQVLAFLVAGHDTTASALAFTLHLLARHPDAQEEIRAETAAVLGDRRPDSGYLGALAATNRVVDEALRLYPPVHTVVRAAAEPTQVLGYDLPAGRIVAVSIWGVHHHPEVWPDPGRFDPGRFPASAAGGRSALQSGYGHLPFGGGPRACIGEHLATAELVTAVAAVVGAYRLRAPDREPALDAGVSLRPRGEVPVGLEPAGSA